ncbi:hypothetical protein BH11PSE3_BH11PSE3_15920 [soil metagenome]
MSVDPPAFPPASGAARRALIQRIDRFLKVLERVRRQPNRREAYHLVEAIQSLRAQAHEQGEQAMTRAEKLTPLPAEVAGQPGPHEALTVADLRAGLTAVERAEG